MVPLFPGVGLARVDQCDSTTIVVVISRWLQQTLRQQSVFRRRHRVGKTRVPHGSIIITGITHVPLQRGAIEGVARSPAHVGAVLLPDPLSRQQGLVVV